MHMAYLSEALLHDFGRKQFYLYCICDQTSWICFTLLIFLGAFLPVGWYFFYLWGDLRHYLWGDIFLPVGWLPQQDPRRGADLNATKKRYFDIIVQLSSLVIMITDYVITILRILRKLSILSILSSMPPSPSAPQRGRTRRAGLTALETWGSTAKGGTLEC